MLESRDQGKPFINAKMIDVPGSAQVRFQNDVRDGMIMLVTESRC